MKFTAACALATATAFASEAERSPLQYGGYGGYGGSYSAPSYKAPSASYGNASYGNASYGGAYGGQNYGYDAGYDYGRRSTIRPRDVKAYNVAPVDGYWKSYKAQETIIASCEFDFLGYSHSTARVELKQKPNDLTSIIGEFEGLKPGLHGFKIHEFGDLEYGCSSTGGVFNPFGAYRGHSHEDILDRRVGDIEQLQARWETDGKYKSRDLLVNLSGPNSVIGRSMVIYEREDDFDQTEHAPTYDREARYREGEGQRIACCVIGLAKGEKNLPKPVQAPSTKLVKPAAKVSHGHFAQPAYGYGSGFGGAGLAGLGGASYGGAGFGAGYGQGAW